MMVRKVTLFPYPLVVCDGVYSSLEDALVDASSNDCEIVEVDGQVNGFVPVYQGKFVTCKYTGFMGVINCANENE